jgi:hypothetical protein
MPPESDTVAALRRLIDERFPAAPRRARRVVPTGVPQLDAVLHGGLVTGFLTEFVSDAPSGGSQLALGSILLSTRLARQRMALVDAADSFCLDGLDDDEVAHVVWVRCGSLAESWRAADLVVRDPNYSVVVIDVRGFPERELLRTRDSIWVRLQRGAEHADTAVAIQTCAATVPNAAVRVVFSRPLEGGCLTWPRVDVVASIGVELQRVRLRAREGFA